MSDKRNRVSLITQISIIFIIGVAIIGMLIFLIFYATSVNYVYNDLSARAESSANDLEGYIKHYPAYEWLLDYWYMHYDEMDIEYETKYVYDTETARKLSLLESRHPGFLPDYVTEEEIRALPEEDQKLYAEIVYAWLIYQMDDMLQDDNIDYVFGAISGEPYDKLTILFIGAEEGRGRGSEPGSVYPVGKVFKSSEEQQGALRSAAEGVPDTARNEDGKYLDYFHAIGTINGETLIIGVTRDITRIQNAIQGQTLKLSLLSIFFMIVLAACCLVLVKAVVLDPLKTVQTGIRRYKDTKDSETMLKDLSEVNSDNELGQLSDDIADLVREIDDYIANIEKITSDRERIQTELGLASRIQQAMLPDIVHSYPDRKEFDIFGSMTPARDVGGDYYDHFMIDDDHLCMYIADVSGKGIPAALFMMASKITLNHNIKLGKLPAQVFSDTNTDVCGKNPEEMFVTVWLGILELSTGQLIACNAGHEYPVMMEAGSIFEEVRDKHGFMIGAAEGAIYKDYEIMMEPGSVLFLYTDGLAEASDINNKQFGMNRILTELNKQRDRSAEEFVRNMKEAVDEFAHDRDQFDDLTMMCVRYNGPAGSSKA